MAFFKPLSQSATMMVIRTDDFSERMEQNSHEVQFIDYYFEPHAFFISVCILCLQHSCSVFFFFF